jgi:SHS2 domain-containing protein
MRIHFLFLVSIIPFLGFSQDCVFVDSVYSTAKLKELGNRDICFGVKQISEDQLSEKSCISLLGDPINIEVFYFGVPKTTLRVFGVEKTEQRTQVGVRFYYKGKKYDGFGESETEIKAIMIELVEGQVPFSKMAVSNALKKAVEECVKKLPIISEKPDGDHPPDE